MGRTREYRVLKKVRLVFHGVFERPPASQPGVLSFSPRTGKFFHLYCHPGGYTVRVNFLVLTTDLR